MLLFQYGLETRHDIYSFIHNYWIFDWHCIINVQPQQTHTSSSHQYSFHNARQLTPFVSVNRIKCKYSCAFRSCCWCSNPIDVFISLSFIPSTRYLKAQNNPLQPFSLARLCIGKQRLLNYRKPAATLKRSKLFKATT